jgi:glutamate-5-semialdehyde dehydrogenase
VIQARQIGLSEALIDRLTLTYDRIESMASDLIAVIDLVDPVGDVFEEQQLKNGLRLHKQRVPLGVIAVIYESRPNVTMMCIAGSKSGNSVILRGDKTLNTNRLLVRVSITH